jgi:acetyl-CoA carboxylase carboxyltransferase component
VTLRQAYGGAHIAMNSRELGATLTLAWPEAQIGVMGGRQAVEVLERRALAAGADVEALAAAYAEAHLPADVAAADGHVDEIVAPADTRERLVAALGSA